MEHFLGYFGLFCLDLGVIGGERAITDFFFLLNFLFSYLLHFSLRVHFIISMRYFVLWFFRDRLERRFVTRTGERLVFEVGLRSFFVGFFHFEAAVRVEDDAVFLLVRGKRGGS